MEAMFLWLNSLVNKNKTEFASWSEINWLNPYAAYDFEAQRTKLLSVVDNDILYNGTKPFYNHISNGCSICGAGKWSCLFITNKCNASCFYCPAKQDTDELPSTQGLDFDNASDYAQYVKHFNFKGVSFSGGEPLLYFDRTLDYLQTVRNSCNPDLYIWMYTNGILAEKNKFEMLANAGLNEIRFDIGATRFSLDNVKKAKGIIPNVTIEIPAILEEKEHLIAMLPDMIQAGVTNLNLHQLRLTNHNASNLIKRGYTIINAEKPIVLESELAALEIISKAKEMGLNIGINYCSFHYKHRFQKAGYRQLIAQKIQPDAVITKAGYLRIFNGNSIEYKTIKLLPNNSNSNDCLQYNFDGTNYFYTIKTLLKEENIGSDYTNRIEQLLSNEPSEAPSDSLLFKIWQMEYIERGLREY